MGLSEAANVLLHSAKAAFALFFFWILFIQRIYASHLWDHFLDLIDTVRGLPYSYIPAPLAEAVPLVRRGVGHPTNPMGKKDANSCSCSCTGNYGGMELLCL